jgi:hypothetical protein
MTEILRQSISSIERSGTRLSETEAAMIDGLSDGVRIILDERLSPLERRLARVEAALGALGVSRDDT